MSTNKIIGERTGALVGDDGVVDARHHLEQLGREIVERAWRWRADVELARPRLRERDQLRERLRWKRRMRHQRDRRRRDKADRREVLARIVARIAVEARID